MHMRFSRIFLLFFIVNLSAQQEGLIILSDWALQEERYVNEEGIGAGTLQLLEALKSDIPILTAKALLRLALEKIAPNPLTTEERKEYEKRHWLVRSALKWVTPNLYSFIESKWIIKSVPGEDYYILIPRKKYSLLSKYLNVDTFPEIKSLMNMVRESAPWETYLPNALSKLFLQSPSEASPLFWTIFLSGHGGIRYLPMWGQHDGAIIISGLRIMEFQESLDFFASKIATKLLIYSSCQAPIFNTTLK